METFQPLGVGLVQSSSTVIPYRMGGIAAVRHKRVRWSTLEGCFCFAFARRVLMRSGHLGDKRLVSELLWACYFGYINWLRWSSGEKGSAAQQKKKEHGR